MPKDKELTREEILAVVTGRRAKKGGPRDNRFGGAADSIQPKKPTKEQVDEMKRGLAEARKAWWNSGERLTPEELARLAERRDREPE